MKGELVGCIQAPTPHRRQRGRHATAWTRRQGAAAISAPETGILHQTVSRLPAANHVFLGPWRLTSARRVTAWDQLPRGDTQHTSDNALMAHPGNQAAKTGEVIKTQGPLGTVHWTSAWSPELLKPGKGTKCMPNWVCALAGYWRTRAAQTWEAHAALSWSKPSVFHTQQALPAHASDICLQYPSLPTAQLNKWA